MLQEEGGGEGGAHLPYPWSGGTTWVRVPPTGSPVTAASKPAITCLPPTCAAADEDPSRR